MSPSWPWIRAASTAAGVGVPAAGQAGAAPCCDAMDAPYLLALALLEQEGRRALPLQGRSLRSPIPAGEDPGEEGRRQALELLVRVWQRSEEGPLRRAAAEFSLLLVEVPLEALQETIPRLKARWIQSGDRAALVEGLQALGGGLWRLGMEPRGSLRYERLV